MNLLDIPLSEVINRIRTFSKHETQGQLIA